MAYEFYVTIEATKQGRFSGKRQHGAVTLTKGWGAASPQLFSALVTNEPIKSALFEFMRTNEVGVEREDVALAFRGIEIANVDARTTASDRTASAK